MTRNTALLKAIEMLEENESVKNYKDVNTVIIKLKEILAERNRPHIYWTKDLVFDRIEEYITEYGVPAVKVFDEENILPSHTVIRNLFNLSVGQFLRQYYPDCLALGKYSSRPKEYWLEAFKKEYVRINAHGITDYDNRRNKSLPCAKTIQSLYGGITSNELLQLVDLKIEGENNNSKVKRSKLKPNYKIESNIENILKLSDTDYMTILANEIDKVVNKYI